MVRNAAGPRSRDDEDLSGRSAPGDPPFRIRLLTARPSAAATFTVTIAPGGQLIFSGEHLFVDDLVTSEDLRGRGHGKELLRWLAARAREQGIPRVDLDSRITAKGFYAKLGFQFLTSIPCWTDAGDLERGGD